VLDCRDVCIFFCSRMFEWLRKKIREKGGKMGEGIHGERYDLR